MRGCNRAVLNGNELAVNAIPRELALVRSDVCRLVLHNAAVSAEFTLDFCIALDEDLMGIEKQFEKITANRRLDIRAIGEFISAASGFGSATGYTDGICTYLYGVLAKERAPDSSLQYDSYIGKFNKAAEELVAYERPLARTIGSLIEFHFNHFREAAHLASNTRVGRAAARYADWLERPTNDINFKTNGSMALSNLDTWVTDWETEQILRWSVQQTSDLLRHVADMESFLRPSLANYDCEKLHILLAETYTASGDGEIALQHAKVLHNLQPLKRWSEAMIRKHSRGIQ